MLEKRGKHPACVARGNGYFLLLNSVFLKAPQVRLEQAKCSFGLQCMHPSSPQTDYQALLLLCDAPPFGDELLGAAKIVFAGPACSSCRVT